MKIQSISLSQFYECSLKVSLQESLKAPLKKYIISQGFTHRISQGATPTYILSHCFLSLTLKVSLKVSLLRSFTSRFSHRAITATRRDHIKHAQVIHGLFAQISSKIEGHTLVVVCFFSKKRVILWWFFIQIRGSSLEETTSYFLRLFADVLASK